MKGDFSRNSFDPTKHYRSVRMQQGRVQLDADWNEQIDMIDHRDRLFTDDFLGEAIGPANNTGFAIGVTGDQQNLTIGSGRYYVDGLLIENDSSLYFTQQTDYPQAVLPSVDGVYLSYLEVWQHSVNLANDVAIAESALGGADTSTRLYTVAQVKLMAADNTGITNLTYNNLFNPKATIDSPAYQNTQRWNALTNRLPSHVDAAQLLPDVTTLKSTTDTMYHIQIHEGGDTSQATYKTSHENPLVEVAITTINVSDPNNPKITVANQPANKQPIFATGQWLELTTPTRDAEKMPGDFVLITAANGVVLTVNGIIGIDIIDSVAGVAMARRWQNNALSVTKSAQQLLEPGLAIHFLGNTFETGGYWTISTLAASHTINWPKKNNQYTALPANFDTISQLTPVVATSPTLQNQLYRIEIHQGGSAGAASFKWSRDNASISSSISTISGNTLTLNTCPQDGVNGFMLNQWLELITPVRELIGTPGDMVQITAINGSLLTVTGNIGSDITVANNAIARQWDTAVAGAHAVNTITVNKAQAIENGLSVIFSGTDFQTGDYWFIPARAALNSQGSHIEWSLDANGNFLPQLPNGIQRSYAPLAIVQRSGDHWTFESDARTIAIPLSELNIKVIGADPCAPADTIHVDCNGQVGISTDTPTAKLDVETNAGLTNQNAIRAIANNGIAITAITKDNKAAVLQNVSTQPSLQINNGGDGSGINANTSAGRAAYFSNSSTTNATLYAVNNGDSITAQFYNTSAAHPTLYAQNSSDYMAAEFVNSSTTHPTLYIKNSGEAVGSIGIEATAVAGRAAHFSNNSAINATIYAVNNGDSITAQFYNTSAAHPTLYAKNFGDYMAAEFVNSSTTRPTLYVTNSGEAVGSIGIEATAVAGRAAYFSNNSTISPTLYVNNSNDYMAAEFVSSSTTHPTLYVTNSGEAAGSIGIEATAVAGRAAYFANNSAINATLYAVNNGDSITAQFYNTSTAHPTLYAKNSGDNEAARLENSSEAATLSVSNSGSGIGAYVSGSTGQAAYFVNNSPTKPTLHVENEGDWQAAYLSNHSSTAAPLVAQNTGNYMAAEFFNSSATYPTLNLTNSVSGLGLNVNGITATQSLIINNANNSTNYENYSLKWSGNTTSLHIPFFIRGTGLNQQLGNPTVNFTSFLSMGGVMVFSTLNSTPRGLALIVINKTNLNIISTKIYDPHADSSQSDALAQAMNQLTNTEMGVLFSSDSWNGNITPSLKAAFDSHGLTKAGGVPNSIGNNMRYPYAAIFDGGITASNHNKAQEVLQNNDGNSPFADLNGWLMKAQTADHAYYSFN